MVVGGNVLAMLAHASLSSGEILLVLERRYVIETFPYRLSAFRGPGAIVSSTSQKAQGQAYRITKNQF